MLDAFVHKFALDIEENRNRFWSSDYVREEKKE